MNKHSVVKILKLRKLFENVEREASRADMKLNDSTE